MNIVRNAGVAVAAAVAAVVVLAGCGSGGVPSTIHGTVTATMLAGSAGPGGAASCILDLPTDGNQILLKASGVTVADAQIDQHSLHTSKNALGETCSMRFTFTGVPGGHQLYEVTVNVADSLGYGCRGTVYYKPAQLAKGAVALSCG